MKILTTKTLQRTTQLQELKTASSLVEAPNSDNKPDMKKLERMFRNITDIKKRNK